MQPEKNSRSFRGSSEIEWSSSPYPVLPEQSVRVDHGHTLMLNPRTTGIHDSTGNHT